MNHRLAWLWLALLLLSAAINAGDRSAVKPPRISSEVVVGAAVTAVPPLEWCGAAAEALAHFRNTNRTLESTVQGMNVPRWTDYIVALSAPGSRFTRTDPPTGPFNAVIADSLENRWKVLVDESERPSETLYFVIVGRIGEPLWYRMDAVEPEDPQRQIAKTTTNICRIFFAADHVLLANFGAAEVGYMPLACTGP